MIFTYIIYNTAILSSSLLVYYASSTNSPIQNKNNKFLFIILAFLCLWIPSAIRYDVGADYKTYEYIYYNLDIYHNLYSLEIGYYYLNKLLYQLNLNAQSIFFVTSFLFSLFIFLSAFKTKNPFLFLLSYCLIFYLNSMNAIRQEIAMSICVYALLFLLEEKRIKFLLLIIIAFLFHSVSILLLPLFFISFFKYNKKFFIFLLIVTLILTFFSTNMNVINILSETFISNTRYNIYLINEEYSGTTKLGSGIGILFTYFLPIIFLLSSITGNSILEIPKKNINLILLMTGLLLIILIISLDLYILHRVLSLYKILIPVLFSFALYNPKRNKNLKFIGIIMLFILFQKSIYDNYKYAENPYISISPYQSILKDIF